MVRVWRGLAVAALVAVAVSVAVGATTASAHLERPSYWPDPAADNSVAPAAGGGVPTRRALYTSVHRKPRGVTRVVCAGSVPSLSPLNRAKRRLSRARRARASRRTIRRLRRGVSRARRSYRGAVSRNPSIRRLRASVESARRNGIKIRPSQSTHFPSRRTRVHFRRLNDRLLQMCSTNSVQTAVTRSRNNDRIVIMPGHYTEPNSRRAPTNDPRCNPRLIQKDASGDNAPSYAYQATCPNDQNLIHLQGRAFGSTPSPNPPRSDRRGIPDVGPCIRCNIQIDGSGMRAEDVILDAGKDYRGKHNDPNSKPFGHAKHVVLRTDRSDGFVGYNFLMKGALEHGFYTEETDGTRLDRTKFFWNADYGHLSFTSDHQLVEHCDGFGSGDAVVYPGASPETGSQRSSFWPDAPRPNSTVRSCDLRGSVLGYSGSMGNAVRITRNHIYGNTTGIASDTLSSAGHPGFPADSSQIDNNYIYSNNLDLYRPDAPVKPLVPVPIGTGILYAGMNDARVHDNHFFDNWREGTRLLAVPDALSSAGGGEGDVAPGISCLGAPANGISTSCGNRYFNNRMGVRPAGFRFAREVTMFGNARSSGSSRIMRNGVDFFWDEFATNRNNCWFGNTGPDGTAGSVTGPGAGAPPDTLPANCSNVGTGDLLKEAILVDCANGPDEDNSEPPLIGDGRLQGVKLACPWWRRPNRPGSTAARREERQTREAARRFMASPEADELRERIRSVTRP